MRLINDALETLCHPFLERLPTVGFAAGPRSLKVARSMSTGSLYMSIATLRAQIKIRRQGGDKFPSLPSAYKASA